MPLALQAKLLRVLQEGTIKPVGSDHEEAVNVRVIAATHQDLVRAVEQGGFREDLYYRLETLTLMVPPLRERDDDVDLLAMHFLRDSARRHQRGFLQLGEVAARMLADYPFPGNVRELASAIERAVTFATVMWCCRNICRPVSASARQSLLRAGRCCHQETWRIGPRWSRSSRTMLCVLLMRWKAINAVRPRYSG